MEITFHCIKIKFAKKYWSFGHGPLLRSNICIKSTLNVLYKYKQETSLRSQCIFYFVKYLILPPTAKFFKLADCQIQIRAQDGSCYKDPPQKWKSQAGCEISRILI